MSVLKAIFLNCSLKNSTEESNTEALIEACVSLFRLKGVDTESIRISDFNIKFAAGLDAGKGDEWPVVYEKIKENNIIVVGLPTIAGVHSSVTQMVIERLQGSFEEADAISGQFPLYGKVAGTIVTGDEDGAHASGSHVLFSLQRLGCTIPPNADCYWLGGTDRHKNFIEANGNKHPFTQKKLRWMTENLIFFGGLLQQNEIPTNLKELAKEANLATR